MFLIKAVVQVENYLCSENTSKHYVWKYIVYTEFEGKTTYGFKYIKRNHQRNLSKSNTDFDSLSDGKHIKMFKIYVWLRSWVLILMIQLLRIYPISSVPIGIIKIDFLKIYDAITL